MVSGGARSRVARGASDEWLDGMTLEDMSDGALEELLEAVREEDRRRRRL